MNLLGKVRRLHYRDGHTLSEIERRTGLTRKTIRKWLISFVMRQNPTLLDIPILVYT